VIFILNRDSSFNSSSSQDLL